MTGSSLPAEVRAALATPREAGGPGAEAARQAIAGYLESLGYRVTVQRFTFSPHTLLAFPVLGAGLGWLTLLQFPLLVLPGLPAWGSPFVLMVGLAGIALVAGGLGMGWSVPGAQLRQDANIFARRGEAPVERWLVAHLDTKAQGHSMAGRLVAIWVVVLAVVALACAAAVRLGTGRPLPVAAVSGVAGLALAAGVLAGRGRLRGQTVGARDNASGVVAALAAAAQSQDPRVGVLITSAEEFGLIGARIFVRASAGLLGREVVNFDTIAEQGDLYVVTHDAASAGLARRLADALGGSGPRVVARRLPLGILVDSIPFARAGVRAATIGRLDWSVLRRIHTPADDWSGLDLTVAEAAGRAIGALEVPAAD